MAARNGIWRPPTQPRLRLYVVHGSHPCAAVEKALQLKGLGYSVWEWPPPMHVVGQKLLSGRRTVPSLRVGGEMLSGSRRIMRRLDQLAGEPRLYPLELDRRAAVAEADRWGDQVFQPIARELIWAGLAARPEALVSYAEHSRVWLPAGAVRVLAPGIAGLQRRLNRTDRELARRRLTELPAHLERIDAWLAEGTLGTPTRPTAAGLQILSTVRLLSTIGDARPLLAASRALSAAGALWPEVDGELPAGAIGRG